jgi:hypothetical protein
VPVRVIGAVGLLGYVAALIQRFYVETAAFGLIVAILGAVMVVGALVALWLYEPGMRPSRAEREPTRAELEPTPVELKAEGAKAI